MSKIDQQLAEAHQKRAALAQDLREAEERARKEQEQSPAARLAQADQEIARLEHDKQREAFESALQRSNDLVYDNRAFRRELVSALEAADFQAAQQAAQKVQDSCDEQRRLIRDVLDHYPGIVEEHLASNWRRENPGMAFKVSYGALVGAFTPTWDLLTTLNDWVYSQNSQQPEHVRRGLSFALVPDVSLMVKNDYFNAEKWAIQSQRKALLGGISAGLGLG